MAATFHRYLLEDFDSENSFFLRFDLTCEMNLLKSAVPALHTLLCQESQGSVAKSNANEVLMHFIDTPGVPNSMQSAIQVFSAEWMDRNRVSCHIGFGFKLRNPSFRADYRPEQMQEWWVKLLEQECVLPEIRTAVLLYADALLFYDNLMVHGILRHKIVSAALFRHKFLSYSISLIIKMHHSFKSPTLVFSTQAKKAVMLDEEGRKIKACEHCRLVNPSIKLLSCSKCMVVRYCSKVCQFVRNDLSSLIRRMCPDSSQCLCSNAFSSCVSVVRLLMDIISYPKG